MTALDSAPPGMHGMLTNRSGPFVLNSAHATEDVVDLVSLEQTLRVAFLARYGAELGDEVTAEAMAWAWENRDQLASVENPTGYLFRVGQSKARRFFRWKRERVRFPIEHAEHTQRWTEPHLPEALSKLDDEARTAVVLVHCFQWTYAEVGDLLDLPLHTVRNRIHRGLTQLRGLLGVNDD